MDFSISDKILNNAKILTYGMDCSFTNKQEKLVPYNPKTCPNIGVMVLIPINNSICQIYYNPTKKIWCGYIKNDNKKINLNSDQFEQFFNTSFFDKLIKALHEFWPLKDPFHRNMFKSLCEKTYTHEIKEDKLVKDCDTGDSGGLVSGNNNSSGGMTSSDILGNCDHENGQGFFGKDCFHLPSGILKNPLKKTKKQFNY